MSQKPEGLSFWIDSAAISDHPALVADLEVDVCIVGAGIAGMTTAYLLAKEGRRVAILEQGSVGGGMTSFTTAHLTAALDDRYYELERYHGAQGIRHAAASHSAAIERIEQIVRDEGIECSFRRVDGFLFDPP